MQTRTIHKMRPWSHLTNSSRQFERRRNTFEDTEYPNKRSGYKPLRQTSKWHTENVKLSSAITQQTLYDYVTDEDVDLNDIPETTQDHKQKAVVESELRRKLLREEMEVVFWEKYHHLPTLAELDYFMEQPNNKTMI